MGGLHARPLAFQFFISTKQSFQSNPLIGQVISYEQVILKRAFPLSHADKDVDTGNSCKHGFGYVTDTSQQIQIP